MATPRQLQHQVDTRSGSVTVQLTVPGGVDRVPMVLVPGVPDEAVGTRIGLRLARAGFAASCWLQRDPSIAQAVVEAARAGALVAAPPPSVALLQLPGMPGDAIEVAVVVEWPAGAPDATEPARLDEALDQVVRRLVSQLP